MQLTEKIESVSKETEFSGVVSIKRADSDIYTRAFG